MGSAALIAVVLAMGGTINASCAETDGPVLIVDQIGFPEGLIHVGEQLMLVDYQRSTVYLVRDHKLVPLWHRAGCGANGLIEVPNGLLVACYDSGVVARLSLRGVDLGDFDRDEDGARLVHPNDFAADAHGGVYLTTSGEGRGSGTLHYVDVDRHVRRLASGIDFANGVALSPDGGTVYVGESRTNTIWSYPVLRDRDVGNPMKFIELDHIELLGGAKGTPDGIRVDQQGNLLVALYEGHGLAVFDSFGKLKGQIVVPGASHTSLSVSSNEEWIDVSSADVFGGAVFRVQNRR